MTITYEWKITGIKTQDVGEVKNVVVQTYWTKTGTDENGNKGIFTGATPFKPDETPVDQMKPFEQLTEADVIGWIQRVVVGQYAEHVDGQIQKQIDKQTIAEAKMPWAPVEPVAEPVTA